MKAHLHLLVNGSICQEYGGRFKDHHMEAVGRVRDVTEKGYGGERGLSSVIFFHTTVSTWAQHFFGIIHKK